MTITPESPGPRESGTRLTDTEQPDPLDRAEGMLNSVDGLPLERHPEAFSAFDELLREALESPPRVSSG